MIDSYLNLSGFDYIDCCESDTLDVRSLYFCSSPLLILDYYGFLPFVKRLTKVFYVKILWYTRKNNEKSKMDNKANYVIKIAELRKEKGITQHQLADALGVETATVQNWERSRTGVNMFVVISKLCKILNCRPDDLVEATSKKEWTKKPGD